MSYYRRKPYGYQPSERPKQYYTRNGWFVKEFDESDERRAKEETDRRIELHGWNNFNRNVETRWIGTMCEWGFRAWLEDKGILYEYLAEGDEIDIIDFQVGTFAIDVKGVSTNYFPKETWATNIDARQYRKIMREDYPVNSLVFARYVLPFKKAVILGVVSKWKLANLSEFYEAGTERGKIILNTDNYELPIYNLSGLDVIEKNRYFDWWLM